MRLMLKVRRENKSLSNEIKDIMDQISEGGRSIHEIDKIRTGSDQNCNVIRIIFGKGVGVEKGDGR